MAMEEFCPRGSSHQKLCPSHSFIYPTQSSPMQQHSVCDSVCVQMCVWYFIICPLIGHACHFSLEEHLHESE